MYVLLDFSFTLNRFLSKKYCLLNITKTDVLSTDILSPQMFCPHGCFVRRMLCHRMFCPYGRFVPRTLCPSGRFVPTDVCPYGRFVHGRFVSRRFVSGRFVSGRFVWALNAHLCKLPVNNFVYTVFETFIRLAPALSCRLFFSMLFTMFSLYTYCIYICTKSIQNKIDKHK
jgi:hypothetical protein